MNPVALLAIVAGVAAIASSKKKGPQKKECPRKIVIDIMEGIKEVENQVAAAVLGESRDPFAIMDDSMRIIFKGSCSKRDSKSIIVPSINGVEHNEFSKSVTQFYYDGVLVIANNFFKNDIKNIEDKIKKDYKSITGKNFEPSA